jgi:ribulose-phosphate 3-epimerase
MKVAVSILGATDPIEQSKQAIRNGVDWIHIDVMDGKFVSGTKFNKNEVADIRKNIPEAFLDCHMMVEDPFNWVEKMQVDMFTFHYESTANHTELIKKIHNKGMKAGIALNSTTDIDLIEPFANAIDMVLILTVDKTGVGGLSLNPDLLKKCKKFKMFHPDIMVEVDGGINMSNIDIVHESGADVLVGGLVILNSTDMKKTIQDMRKA